MALATVNLTIYFLLHSMENSEDIMAVVQKLQSMRTYLNPTMPTDLQKWEYLRLYANSEYIDGQLAEAGKKGWNLIFVADSIIYLQRPLSLSPQ